MESLSKRLIGSNGKILAVQGHVPDGPYTICFGIIDYVDHPRTVEGYAPAYRYSNRYQNLTQSIPSRLRNIPEPARPMIYCKPVDNVTSVQKLLEELGFEHLKNQFHFHKEKCKTPVNPVNHQGIDDFKQDYVARIYPEEKRMGIIWSVDK